MTRLGALFALASIVACSSQAPIAGVDPRPLPDGGMLRIGAIAPGHADSSAWVVDSVYIDHPCSVERRPVRRFIYLLPRDTLISRVAVDTDSGGVVLGYTMDFAPGTRFENIVADARRTLGPPASPRGFVWVRRVAYQLHYLGSASRPDVRADVYPRVVYTRCDAA